MVKIIDGNAVQGLVCCIVILDMRDFSVPFDPNILFPGCVKPLLSDFAEPNLVCLAGGERDNHL